MIFVRDALSLKLPMEFPGSFIKSEFIIATAVEINGQTPSPYLCPIPLRKHKRAVLVPVAEVNGIAEHRSQQPAQRCWHRLCGLPRRFGEERGALRADRRK